VSYIKSVHPKEEGSHVAQDQFGSTGLHGGDDAGQASFHDWIGNGWAILFSHPKDFTPVCTTELGYMARLKPEFDKRSTKVVGPQRRPRRQITENGPRTSRRRKATPSIIP